MPLRDDHAGLEFSASADTGGELSSLRVRFQGRWVELLDRAGEPGPPEPGRWRGRAPWLFPAVGRSRAGGKLGVWRHGGLERPMPPHGFVMDRPWEALATEPGRVGYRFRGGAAERDAYPFDFELTAAYEFCPGGVLAALEVSASRGNGELMPFSVGNHLTLRLPFGSGTRPANCVLRSPARERWELSPEGFLTGWRTPLALEAGVRLGDDPSLLDAVLGGFAAEAAVEVADPASFAVRVEHRAAERAFFVLWGDPGRGFFCPEPWLGGPDSLNERAGIVELEPGGRFRWEWRLLVRR